MNSVVSSGKNNILRTSVRENKIHIFKPPCNFLFIVNESAERRREADEAAAVMEPRRDSTQKISRVLCKVR